MVFFVIGDRPIGKYILIENTMGIWNLVLTEHFLLASYIFPTKTFTKLVLIVSNICWSYLQYYVLKVFYNCPFTNLHFWYVTYPYIIWIYLQITFSIGKIGKIVALEIKMYINFPSKFLLPGIVFSKLFLGSKEFFFDN